MKKKLLIAVLFGSLVAGCSINTTGDITTDVVIEQFEVEGLEIGAVSDLDNSEFGNIREEGKRILVPSLGADNGGRLYRFSDDADLQQAKSYYDGISNSGPLFYNHTYQSGNLLLQMNGEMSDEDFAKYTAVLDELN